MYALLRPEVFILASLAAGSAPGAQCPTDATAALLDGQRRARNVVAEYRVDPLRATRTYALVSFAQQGALETEANQPAVAALIAATRALQRLWPLEAARLQREMDALLAACAGMPGAAAADAAGRVAALTAVAAFADDGSESLVEAAPPPRPDAWRSIENRSAVRPAWAHVRPVYLERGDAFRPPPPPALESPDFAAALGEVRRISDARTQVQIQLAWRWDDGPGTGTPAGHWNEVAAELIRSRGLGPREAAQLLAFLNGVLLDATIACWDAKYTYWLARPTTLDPEITTVVLLPNFPAYPSGHATISSAAAEVLAHAFPADAERLRAMAREAAESRIVAGLHYRFDSSAGLDLGIAVARHGIRSARFLRCFPPKHSCSAEAPRAGPRALPSTDS